MSRILAFLFLWSLFATCAAAQTNIVSAVLPNARAVEVGTTASAFAVIINAGGETATNCRPEFDGAFAGEFAYQTSLPPDNTLSGTPNTPIDIASGEAQHFVFSIRPDEAFEPLEMGLTKVPATIC